MFELASLASDPFLLALALFGATFIAEDAATVGAGVLVANSEADPAVAVTALILGTAIGDLALYAAGRWGAGTKFGRSLRARRDVQRAEGWLVRRALLLVTFARFIPGSRLPVFTASGMTGVPFARVAAIVALTTPLWTGLLFEVARRSGAAATGELTQWAILAAVLLLIAPLPARILSRNFERNA